MTNPPRPTIPVPPPDPDDAQEAADSAHDGGERRPYFLFVTGAVRPPFLIDTDDLEIGRGPGAELRLDEPDVSRVHAHIRRTRQGTFILEDASSINRSYLNGKPLIGPTILSDGDRLQLGRTLLKFVMHDEIEEKHQRALYSAAGVEFQQEAPTSTRRARPWSPDSWTTKPLAQGITYADPAMHERVVKKLRSLPPLVTSWEIEELKSLIADAQDGNRIVLQGGNCAETLDECGSERIANTLKILIQMSIVLIRSAGRPVIRIGRFAGQYAKPRSSLTEVRNGVELPSYFGDLINRAEFTEEARRPDAQLLVTGYLHAAATLNFIRSLLAGGFADLRRPEYFDLSSFGRADLSAALTNDYQHICGEISDTMNFVRSFGNRPIDEMMKVSFFASHEGLNLTYEGAQTRRVPRRPDFYDLTTHLPWIGERTRALDGAHVEFYRGIANPVAVKLGPKTIPEEAVDLCKLLNPRNEAGKIILVPRMGAKNVAERLPALLIAIQRARQRVLWVCDPMHGNAAVTRTGVKTRNFDDILAEIETSIDVHESVGTHFGGVHFELTGEDVTECIGAGLTEDDLSRNYESLCDPRLNYRQALEMAFALGRRLSAMPRRASTHPPPTR